MVFSPKRKKQEPETKPRLPERRVVSDIRPAGSSGRPAPRPIARPVTQPIPEEKKPIVNEIPQGIAISRKPEARKLSIETFAPAKEPPLSDLPKFQRSKNGFKVKIIAGAVVSVAILGSMFYVYTTSTLALVVMPVKGSFDLGTGVTMTLPAREFSVSSVKRGQGDSKNAKKFSERASGTIVVYNNYGKDPQTLIEKTRFQANGLTFRSTSRVIVPGKNGDTPGSVEVAIIADQPGDKYNVGMADFTIPGFAGTAKYTKFYGRSKTEIKGGSVGEGKVVGKEEADELLKSLEADMTSELADTFVKSIPDTVMSFPDKTENVVTQRITDPPVGSPGDHFFGEVRGETRTFVIDKTAYAAALGQLLYKDRYQQGLYILREDASRIDIKSVTFDKDKKTATLVLAGKVVFESTVNVDELRTKVLSAGSYNDLNAVYQGYPAIKAVEPTFSPAFLKRIPRDSKYLTIEIRH